MGIKKGGRIVVKGVQYEVLDIMEEARTSIKPHIKSYTAVYLHKVNDQSDDPSLILEIREDKTYMIDLDKKRTKLKPDEIKIL